MYCLNHLLRWGEKKEEEEEEKYTNTNNNIQRASAKTIIFINYPILKIKFFIFFHFCFVCLFVVVISKSINWIIIRESINRFESKCWYYLLRRPGPRLTCPFWSFKNLCPGSIFQPGPWLVFGSANDYFINYIIL